MTPVAHLASGVTVSSMRQNLRAVKSFYGTTDVSQRRKALTRDNSAEVCVDWVTKHAAWLKAAKLAAALLADYNRQLGLPIELRCRLGKRFANWSHNLGCTEIMKAKG